MANFADDNTLYVVSDCPRLSKYLYTGGGNLNVLKRVGKHLPIKVKMQLYKTYISCHFNFCPLVWHFCSTSNTDMLEKLQYRALRFVFDDYESDYDKLLVRANMPSLELSRLGVFVSKSLNV